MRYNLLVVVGMNGDLFETVSFIKRFCTLIGRLDVQVHRLDWRLRMSGGGLQNLCDALRAQPSRAVRLSYHANQHSKLKRTFALRTHCQHAHGHHIQLRLAAIFVDLYSAAERAHGYIIVINFIRQSFMRSDDPTQRGSHSSGLGHVLSLQNSSSSGFRMSL